ncbi:hypothetical protein [Zhongshania sp. BJYM1]|uniref:hypothetical protein n=1 Tax=Zhongshania aquatica TaxID=2965069 RepID=UPI0022B49AA8|nr:hypothetical protein [Marortus sp. BJYM1]
MKIGIILCLGWALIHLFKKLGMEQLPCGLLAGLLASIIVNVAFFFMGEPVVNVILSVIGFTTMAVVYGFFASRKIYGRSG